MTTTLSSASPTTTTPLLAVEGLAKHFPVSTGGWRSETLRAVDDVDLHVARGEILALVGESGSGKSTLGRCVLGLETPTAGSIRFDGRETPTSRSGLLQLRRRVQPVFQDPYSSFDPRWTVGRTVREALDVHGIGTDASRDARVRELLEEVGMPPTLADRRPGQLSGGQLQRIAVAAALALEPELLVADEPVSALDVSVQAQVLNLLSRLRAELDLSILFIAHDLAVVEHIADRIAVMYLGRIVEVGTTAEVFGDPRHPYTQALLAAIPHPEPRKALQPPELRGEIPSPLDPPTGCRFHPRCPVAVERCRTTRPGPTDFSTTHEARCFVAAANA